MNNDEKKLGGTLGEGEASNQKETLTVLKYEPYYFDDEYCHHVSINDLPWNISDPESWEKIAQFCKNHSVNIVCHLNEPYKGSSYIVFRESGKYLFFAEHLLEQATDFATSYVVISSSFFLYGDNLLRVYYVNPVNSHGFILYKKDGYVNCDEVETQDKHVDTFESLNGITDEIVYYAFHDDGDEI